MVVHIVFDTLNKVGTKFIKEHMKEMKYDATMCFYVDSAKELAEEINATIFDEEKYYRNIDKKGFKLSTKVNMYGVDLFNMIKMIHIKLN